MSEGGREGGGGGADTELKTKNPHVNAGKHVLVDVGQICRFFPVCTAFLLTRPCRCCHFLSLPVTSWLSDSVAVQSQPSRTPEKMI